MKRMFLFMIYGIAVVSFSLPVKAEPWPGKCIYFLQVKPTRYYPYDNYTAVIHDTEFDMETGQYVHTKLIEVPGYYCDHLIVAYYCDGNTWVPSSGLVRSTSKPPYFDGTELPADCSDCINQNLGPNCDN